MPTARNKLNAASCYGNLLIAAFVGLVFDSWLVFAVGMGVLTALSVQSGNIRTRPTKKHRR